MSRLKAKFYEKANKTSGLEISYRRLKRDKLISTTLK